MALPAVTTHATQNGTILLKQVQVHRIRKLDRHDTRQTHALTPMRRECGGRYKSPVENEHRRNLTPPPGYSLTLKMFRLSVAIALLSLTAQALGATYGQTDSYVGSGFLSGFSFEAIADPTHGRV